MAWDKSVKVRSGHHSTTREYGSILAARYDSYPFYSSYDWFNTSDNLIIQDPTISNLNTYVGGVYRMSRYVLFGAYM